MHNYALCDGIDQEFVTDAIAGTVFSVTEGEGLYIPGIDGLLPVGTPMVSFREANRQACLRCVGRQVGSWAPCCSRSCAGRVAFQNFLLSWAIFGAENGKGKGWWRGCRTRPFIYLVGFFCLFFRCIKMNSKF